VRGALAAQLRAAAKSARRDRQGVVQCSALPERHLAPACSAAQPPLRLRAASPETELDPTVLHRRVAALDSVAPRREGPVVPEMVVLRLLAGWTAAALESALLRAAWAVPKAVVWRPTAARQMARPSARLAARVRRLAGPVVSAAQAAEVPQQEVAAWDVAEGARVVAARGEAEAPQPAVAWVWAELPPEVVRQQEARDAAAVPLRAVPVVRVAEPRAARPSAVPWVFRRDQALPWPAPQSAVRFALAMQCLRIALPLALSWQAVRDEVLS
jgi:hypothetical protein